MAIIRRPSPFGELAKLLGGAAEDVQQYKDIRALGREYAPYFGGDEKKGRAAARNPQQASALFRMKAAEEKQRQKGEKEEASTRNAIEQLEAAKNQIQARKKIESDFPFIEKNRGRLLGQREETQATKALYKNLRQNDVIKELGIVLPNAEDASDLQLDLLDAAIDKVRGQEDQEKAREKEAEAEERETSDEKAAREQQEDEAAASPPQKQVDQAEDELDVQDVAEQAAPNLQDAPVDDLENDEKLDPAALQMQQEVGAGMQMPQQQMGALAQQAPGIMDQVQGLGAPQRDMQPVGARYAPGENIPQGTSLEGLGGEGVNVGRSALAGAAGAPRALANLAGLAQRATEYIPGVGGVAQGVREAGLDFSKGAEYLPAREKIYEALGGNKLEAGSLEKAINDFAGDVPEQLATAAILGVTGGVPGMKGAVQRVFSNVLGSQFAGNAARFMAEQVSGPGEFADGVKNAVTFLYAVGQGPTMKKVAGDTLNKAKSELSDAIRIRDTNYTQKFGEQLHKAINEGTSGVKLQDYQVLRDIAGGGGTYKQGLSALDAVASSDAPASVKRLAGVFREHLMRDLMNNHYVEKDVKDLFKSGSEMWKQYKLAEKVGETIANSGQVQNLVKKGTLGKVADIFFSASLTNPLRPLRKAKDLALDVGARTMQGLYQWATDKNLQPYYNQVIKSAMETDGAGIAKGLQQMERIMEGRSKQSNRKKVFSKR